MPTPSLTTGFIIDPIASLNRNKDSSIAMMLAAQRRGWPLFIMQQGDLYLDNSRLYLRCQQVEIDETALDGAAPWYRLGQRQTKHVADFDLLFMRKDPPFDMEYITTTWLLDHAARAGVRVVNPPARLRDFNEKLFISRFPQCCAPYCVSRERQTLRDFVLAQGEQGHDTILKPLDGMGGASIFRTRPADPNLSVILETLTAHDSKSVMAQQFIARIDEGDKRILLIDGQPVPYALARIPAEGESRGNLAAGGRGEGRELSDRDRWLCAQIGPFLKQQGIVFAGIDVIGDYLTEINITSPTCIRELDRLYGLDIAGELMDALVNSGDKQ